MLYYEAPYLREVEVNVIKKEGSMYLLSNTILYPGGGGQPEDYGTAICGGRELRVRHTGNLWHELSGDCDCERIKLVLDWERRYWLMRSHTAEHTFFRFLQNRGAELGKVALGEESTIIFEGDITIEDILDAERETRRLIREGREVRVFWIEREEMSIYPQLRIRLDRIRDEKIRVVEIEGHDISACKGIHVKNLAEIGDFCITHVRLGKRKEVKFVVAERAAECHERFSQNLRSVSWRNNVEAEKLDSFIANLLEERERSFEALKAASEMLPFQEEKCGDKKFFYLIFYGGDRKTMVRRIMELVHAHTGIAVYGDLNSHTVMCAFSEGLEFRELILELLREFGGKGGGRGNFISGRVNNIEEFMEELKRRICEV